MSIRILLADDHEIVLDGLRSLLGKHDDLKVVGQAKDGRGAIAEAHRLAPDLVIMDITMPGMNGIDATRAIVAETEARVVCLSMHSEKRFVEAVLAAGAAGYLLKDAALDELTVAIRTVASGQVYLSPAIAGTLVQAHRDKSPLSVTRAVLTTREREVLQLLAEGNSTKEIASIIGVSPKTVGTYREHLMAKLAIRSVAGLTKYAIREGLTSV